MENLQVNEGDLEQFETMEGTSKNEVHDHLALLEIEKQKVIALISSAQASLEKYEIDAAKASKEQKKLIQEMEGAQKSILDAKAKSQEELGGINAHRESLTTLVAQALADQAKTAALSAKAESVEKVLAGYELELKSSHEKASELLLQIEGLLPGATSAGLASAFQHRKNSFRNPKRIWFCVLIGSIMGLTALAFLGPQWTPQGDVTKNFVEFSLYLLRKAPFAGPLIWLALIAGRHYAYSLKLEEDYGHKEALARTFEGYKRLLEEVSATAKSDSPIIELCSKMLEAISRRPGVIYIENQEDITPLHIAAGAVARVTQQK